MSHPLDRPIWSALTGRQARLAEGDARAVRLRRDMGVFAAARPGDEDALTALTPANGALAVFEDAALPPPPGLRVVEVGEIVQMVAPTMPEPDAAADIAALQAADAPAMLALAELTRPGPFALRTPDFGGFVGVRRGGALVAMAGTRLAVPGHREISGVCTHPDHRGHGFAARLMTHVGAAIRAAGDVPILHTYAHNQGAIALYERLGFALRRTLVVTFLERAGPGDTPGTAR
jgi:ribosomal protein S18 acetylase RimI-like enzyme